MRRYFLFILAAVLLTACSANETSGEVKEDKQSDSEAVSDSKDSKPGFEAYQGKPLKIAVIGEPPAIKEEDLVTFTKLGMDELKSGNVSKYDAVIVKHKYLKQAAKSEYAEVYKQAKLPFFFIQSEKTFLAFTISDLSYKDARSLSNQEYAVGFVSKEDGYSYWKYGLYNDKESDQNIKDVYSRIFKTIETTQESI